MRNLCTFLFLFIFSPHSFIDNPHIAYRASTLFRFEVEEAVRFYPKENAYLRPNQPSPNINLWDHVHAIYGGLGRSESGYISTAVSRDFAMSWVNNPIYN